MGYDPELSSTYTDNRFPVSELPERLRAQVQGSEFVQVSVRPVPSKMKTMEELLADLDAYVVPDGKGVTIEEAVKRIRDLRDEWD